MTRRSLKPRHRDALPQTGDRLFLTDGGLETTLIFHDGLELPDFAAFDLLRRPGGEPALERYFHAYAQLARRHGTGLVLESPTWRASHDWGTRLGYSCEDLVEANRRSIALLERVREAYDDSVTPIVISGCVGPRGDGYDPSVRMTAEQAEDYHREQVAAFAGTAADLVTAITMTHAEEAAGIARAARGAGIPVAISFTVETDGRLPTGQRLEMAIAHVDAVTSGYPSYYMINCAHPTHFDRELATGARWIERIRGLRANASCKSHAELNESPTLDIGDPAGLGRAYAELVARMPWLTVLGGCCGTDHRHVDEIAAACARLARGRVA